MVLMDHDEFIQELRYNIPEEELPSIENDRFGIAFRPPIAASKFRCFSVLMEALTWSSKHGYALIDRVDQWLSMWHCEF